MNNGIFRVTIITIIVITIITIKGNWQRPPLRMKTYAKYERVSNWLRFLSLCVCMLVFV